MLKRVCDRCEKEINTDKPWFQIRCEKMKEDRLYCGAGIHELCEDCFNDFKAQLANNN